MGNRVYRISPQGYIGYTGYTVYGYTMPKPLIPTERAQPQDLGVDLFFFFSQVFFISISVQMGLIMVTHLGPGIDRITPDAPSAKSKAKAGEALEEHITSYRARGFIIRTVTSDGEPAVKAMFNQLQGENIILNVIGHGTHIPHVESAI